LEPLASHHENMSTLARALGVDRAQLGRWRRTGVTPSTADRLAVRLGFHPAELWPQWFDLPTGVDEAA
jgi:transposase-like protein